jgi:hypothetical protein
MIHCPYCKEGVGARSTLVRCKTCRAFHHKECWSNNGKCTVFGCQSLNALEYRGSLSRLFRWPRNAITVLAAFFLLVFASGIFELPLLLKFTVVTVCMLCAYICFTTYRDPDRSGLSRWVWNSCEQHTLLGARALPFWGVFFVALGIIFVFSVFTIWS